MRELTVRSGSRSGGRRGSRWFVGGNFVLGAVLAAAGPAFGGNAPEGAQRRAEEDILPKLAVGCGVSLALKYDGDSLRKHNKDIGYDQTTGSSECDEPLRYIWYACGTEAGKAAIAAARLSRVVCKGTPRPVGALTVSGGTITVERAFEEKQPYLRSRGQFEAALKIALAIGEDDPYSDEAWRQLAMLPNPVTSTKTYCLVNDQKVAFDENVYDPFHHRKQDAKVKCWKDGGLVIDLILQKGQKTGFLTRFRDKTTSNRESYKDGKLHGEQTTLEAGKPKSVAFYDSGDRIWSKEFHPSGKVASYSRKFADGSSEYSVKEDGKVYRLRCSPAAKGDKELRQRCGFDGAVTTEIYDGTGKVARVQTWQDGVLQKERPGTSDYGSRSEVAFKDGKKHGPERLFGKNGELAALVNWDRGTKDGRELTYAQEESGQAQGGGQPKPAAGKVVKEIVWRAGEMRQLTEFYLNGNPKLQEAYQSPQLKRVKAFWDTGKVSREGDFVACERRGTSYRNWCEEGSHKAYFESGAPEAESMHRAGKRQGTTKTWWANGKPASLEEYVDDKLTKAKRWDKDGALVTDEEYESDGSRKLRRP